MKADAALFETSPLKPSATQLLSDLVLISSKSGDIQGIDQVFQYVIDTLTPFGMTHKFHSNPFKSEEKLLTLHHCPNTLEHKHITLIAHADCVLENKAGTISIEQGKLIGPGAADNKGGIVVGILALMDYLQSSKRNDHNICFVISPSEETGSIGWHKTFAAISNQTSMAFGLEPAINGGDLINSRSGNIWYDITAIGVQGHSGRLGRRSQNAAHALLLLGAQLLELEDQFSGISININSLSSDHDVFNQVCGKARIKVDVRFQCNQVQQTVHDLFEWKLKKIFEDHQRRERNIHLFYSVADHCPAMKSSTESVVDHRQRAYLQHVTQAEGFSPALTHSGGAADINYFAQGHPCLDGLGPVGGNLHRRDEYVVLETLQSRAVALSKMLQAPDPTYLTHTTSRRDDECKNY